MPITHRETSADHPPGSHLRSPRDLALDELPVLPLFVPDDLYGARSEVVFKPRADGRILLLEMGFAPAGAGGQTEEMR